MRKATSRTKPVNLWAHRLVAVFVQCVFMYFVSLTFLYPVLSQSVRYSSTKLVFLEKQLRIGPVAYSALKWWIVLGGPRVSMTVPIQTL